jgi:hypothetical protein
VAVGEDLTSTWRVLHELEADRAVAESGFHLRARGVEAGDEARSLRAMRMPRPRRPRKP